MGRRGILWGRSWCPCFGFCARIQLCSSWYFCTGRRRKRPSRQIGFGCLPNSEYVRLWSWWSLLPIRCQGFSILRDAVSRLVCINSTISEGVPIFKQRTDWSMSFVNLIELVRRYRRQKLGRLLCRWRLTQDLIYTVFPKVLRRFWNRLVLEKYDCEYRKEPMLTLWYIGWDMRFCIFYKAN